MFQKLKDMFLQAQPQEPRIVRLIEPFLSNYARLYRGHFVLVDDDSSGGNNSEPSYEIRCLFARETATAAVEYVQNLMDGFGYRCRVSAEEGRSKHLPPQALFVYELRSPDRQIA